MILENIRLALLTMKANKTRAFLTMLGIIIGIMSIITIVVIGDALTDSVSGNFDALGKNNITISVRERGTSGSAMMANFPGRRSQNAKTPETDDLLTDQMIADMRGAFGEDVAGVSMSYSGGEAQARDGARYANVAVSGVNADYQGANNITMLAGSFIAQRDLDSKGNVAVVSDKFVKNMFPGGGSPIGKEVKVYRSDRIEIYTIIGEYESSDAFAGTASERDETTAFYIPLTTAKQDVLEKNFASITVIGAEDGDVQEITERLERFFANYYLGNKDWQVNVSNLSSILDTVTSILGVIQLAFALIGGISLLVGGIGVMNIMVVSVTERTREIGTRKALGALNGQIQLQFVTEAVIITAIGGVLGTLLGVSLGAIAAKVLGAPLSVSPLTILGSVGFSAAIGVGFGLYPANKAAKLDPIEALRYE
ncbi:MAG: ABC transporter permease [Oscillospiraceae bacterium]|jgi:putative ABC transport system permease protein|nr:ABC transporter permease [Oscillospiraceae bacterium]